MDFGGIFIVFTCLIIIIAFMVAYNKDEKKTKSQEKPPTIENPPQQPVLEENTDFNVPNTEIPNTVTTQKNNENVNPSPTSNTDGYELKYSYDDVLIAGTKYYNIPKDINIGTSLDLIPEPENKYDSNAIAVFANGEKIGHVPKNRLQDMIHDFIKRGDILTARISSINEDSIKMAVDFYGKPMGFSVNVNVDFDGEKIVYSVKSDRNNNIKDNDDTEEEHNIKTNIAKRKSFRLTGNTNEEMQDNIALCDEDESVTIEYDYDKEKYIASASGEIGYFPKNANDFLEPLVSDLSYNAFIEKIDENEDNGKYSVHVVVEVESEE